MKKETRLEFQKQYRERTRKFRKVNQITFRLDIISDIIRSASFGHYLLSWTKVAIDHGSRKDFTYLDIYDNSLFTMEDYEFILWFGFVHMYNSFIKKASYSVNNPKKISFNDKLTLELFNLPEYESFLDYVLSGLTEDHVLYDYRNNKRKQLMASERIQTIKNIVKS